jgi:hypothetical protein
MAMTLAIILSISAPLATGVAALLWAAFMTLDTGEATAGPDAPDLRTW